MGKRIKGLLIIFIIFFSTVSGAGMSVGAEELSWDKLGQVIYNSTNGLMSSNVTSIRQTADGIVWIGTDSGIAAFDGNEFTEYGPFYHFDGINDIMVTAEGSVWYATTTYGGAINLETRFQHFHDFSEDCSNYATSIVESSEGKIYVGTIRHLYSVAPKEGYVIEALEEADALYTTALAAGENNDIAGVTINGEIFFMKDDEVVKRVDGGFKGKAAITYYRGYFLVGTPDGEIIGYSALNDYEEEMRFTTPLGDTSINNFFIEEGERIWVLGEDGIGYYELPEVDMTSSVIHSIKYELEKAEFVECSFKDFESGYTDMMKDYQGNYWITSSKRGVLLLRNSFFVDEFSQMDIDVDVVNGVVEQEGLLYVATDSELLIINKKDKSLINNELTDVLQNKKLVDLKLWNDTLIAAVYGEGLYVFENNKLQQIVSDKLVSKRINGMELLDNQLYVLTDGGVVVFDESGEYQLYDTASGLYNPKITCVIKGAFGRQSEERLYLGSDGAGIYVFKDGKLEVCIDESYNIASKNVNSMRAYDKGFFIATDSGISYYNGKKIVEFERLPEELSERSCQELYIMDEQLYVVCDTALYIISLEDLFYGDKNEELEFSFFDENAGFLSVVTTGAHGYMSADGTLYIPCVDKVYSINKDFDNADIASFKLMLQNVKADNITAAIEELSPEENKYQVNVGSDTEEINLMFSVLEFSNEDPYVRYILHGVDTEFTTIRHSQLEEIVYEELAGGSYEFWFELLGEDGEAVDRITLMINKEKSFFENLWVRMLGLAGGFAILMYFVFKDKKH